MNRDVLTASTRVIRGEDSGEHEGLYADATVQSTIAAHRLLTARLAAGRPLDVTIAGLTLAATVALLAHGGLGVSRAMSGLDPLTAALAACAAAPLLAWRRAPLAAFAAAALLTTALAGLDRPLGLAPAPIAAL